MALASAKNGSVRWAFNFGSWSPTEKQLLLASSCLQPDEKERIGRFVYQKDSKASLIGRLLMRKYANECAGNRGPIMFARDERGKPYIVEEELKNRLSFNVSHQGNFTVLAGETQKTVGIDVMKIEYSGGKNLSEFFRLMTRQFSPEEWVTIRGFPGTSDREKLAMFCRHWCLKESYVKATGVGITVDLQKITFRINTSELDVDSVTEDTKLFVEGKKMAEWHFEETLLDREHCVAVAWKQNSVDNCGSDKKTFHFLEFDDLVGSYDPFEAPDPIFCQNFLQKEEKPV